MFSVAEHGSKPRDNALNIINLRHFLKSKKKDRIFPGGEMRKFLNIRQENGYQRIYERRIIETARGNKPNVFIRNRKMPVSDILISILTSRRQTVSMELRNFFEKKKKVPVSKQAYLKARLNLNPEVFRVLNDDYLKGFYNVPEEKEKWKDYLVFAVDGSRVEIPNSAENRKKYGFLSNQNETESPARAIISGLYDVLNRFFLDLQVCSIKESELDAAEKNLLAIKRIGIEDKILVIFDRGYPGFEMLYYLEKMGLKYIIRLSSDKFDRERKQLKTDDEEAALEITRKRLENVRKRNPEIYQEMKNLKEIKTRFIREISPSGQDFYIMTNLETAIDGRDICDAYFLRWKIEEAFNTLKNKMKFESVTGQASIYVEQDFLAQIHVYNMMEDIVMSAEEGIEESKNTKYRHRINENMAIGLFSQKFIDILLAHSIRKRKRLLKKLINEMKKYLLPVRPSFSRKRKFTEANKYSANQKSSF